jgi:hypothetical protein
MESTNPRYLFRAARRRAHERYWIETGHALDAYAQWMKEHKVVPFRRSEYNDTLSAYGERLSIARKALVAELEMLGGTHAELRNWSKESVASITSKMFQEEWFKPAKVGSDDNGE